MTPRWRWWLFCASLSLSFRFEWDWAGRLMSWCVLAEWVAGPEELAVLAAGTPNEEAPF